MTHVLLAEDDPAIAEPLARALTREGYNVVVQGTGQGAIDSASGADIVVLDLGLPDMDGLDVAREIRHKGLTTPLLVLTSGAFRKLLRDTPSLQLKVLDTLAKRLPPE